jgi:hypothetical protein
MEVLTSALCDSASDYQGKLCILGTFDTIWARQFPCVHQQCSLAFRFLFREGDQGKHAFKVALIDSDGRNVFPDGGPGFEIDIHEIPDQTYFLSQNIVINLQGLPFPKPGLYSVDVKMDTKMVTRIPLQVVQHEG